MEQGEVFAQVQSDIVLFCFKALTSFGHQNLGGFL